MKVILKSINRNIKVKVVHPDNKTSYGVVIGCHEGIIGIRLTTGEYVDVPESQVREYKKSKKECRQSRERK